MKDLTTEQYRLIYEQPIYPKNLYARPRAVQRTTSTAARCSSRRCALLQERGIYAPVEAPADAPAPPPPEPLPLDLPPGVVTEPADSQLTAHAGTVPA